MVPLKYNRCQPTYSISPEPGLSRAVSACNATSRLSSPLQRTETSVYVSVKLLQRKEMSGNVTDNSTSLIFMSANRSRHVMYVQPIAINIRGMGIDNKMLFAIPTFQYFTRPCDSSFCCRSMVSSTLLVILDDECLFHLCFSQIAQGHVEHIS